MHIDFVVVVLMTVEYGQVLLPVAQLIVIMSFFLYIQGKQVHWSHFYTFNIFLQENEELESESHRWKNSMKKKQKKKCYTCTLDVFYLLVFFLFI